MKDMFGSEVKKGDVVVSAWDRTTMEKLLENKETGTIQVPSPILRKGTVACVSDEYISVRFGPGESTMYDRLRTGGVEHPTECRFAKISVQEKG